MITECMIYVLERSCVSQPNAKGAMQWHHSNYFRPIQSKNMGFKSSSVLECLNIGVLASSCEVQNCKQLKTLSHHHTNGPIQTQCLVCPFWAFMKTHQCTRFCQNPEVNHTHRTLELCSNNQMSVLPSALITKSLQ